MQRIRVSENRRFLVHEDGTPFFYLADTAWELFHRLDRSQTLRFLADRAAKRFTVIQAVALAEMDGLNTPAANGHKPLIDNDPLKPNEPYWQHVDWVIVQAAALGLRIGLLPTWGDKWNKGGGIGPEIFTPENADAYGQWIGRRYRDAGVIWIVGGDRKFENDTHRQIVSRMATGIREADGGRNLISLHPHGGGNSAEVFHTSSWLDFNMWQTGHGRNTPNYDRIAVDYNRTNPVKPVLDAEPAYEDHPAGFNLDNGYIEDYDCRKHLYWSVFAGACGYTYGCHPIWQFWQPERAPKSFCRTHWDDAMRLPGSAQMQWCRALVESRPYLSRVPDQSMIVSENKGGSHHVQATRDADGSYALVYCPYYNPVTIDLTRLSGKTLVAWWFDPRTGACTRAGDIDRAKGRETFQPPHGGPDWILVLDDASRNFGRPGEGLCQAR